MCPAHVPVTAAVRLARGMACLRHGRAAGAVRDHVPDAKCVCERLAASAGVLQCCKSVGPLTAAAELRRLRI